MKLFVLKKGPSGADVRIALAQLALSADGKPTSLPFTVNEGTEEEPKLVSVYTLSPASTGTAACKAPSPCYCPLPGKARPQSRPRSSSTRWQRKGMSVIWKSKTRKNNRSAIPQHGRPIHRTANTHSSNGEAVLLFYWCFSRTNSYLVGSSIYGEDSGAVLCANAAQ